MTDAERIPLLPLLPGLLGMALLAGVLLAGWDYYVLPPVERLHHPRHFLFRSSGDIGLWCGVAGTALFLVNLAYLVRKRLLHVPWLGTLRAWMHVHVLSGLVGAGLIALHCAFRPRSSLGLLALAGLAVVILTGLLGRYIYAHLPRAGDGRELDAPALRRRLQELGVRLGIRDHDVAFVQGPRGVFARLRDMVLGDREARREFRRFKQSLRDRADRATLRLAREFYRDRQRLARYAELRGLMGSWRFLHRWLAILMIVLAAFHIVLAVSFGDLWGGR